MGVGLDWGGGIADQELARHAQVNQPLRSTVVFCTVFCMVFCGFRTVFCTAGGQIDYDCLPYPVNLRDSLAGEGFFDEGGGGLQGFGLFAEPDVLDALAADAGIEPADDCFNFG